MPWGLNVVRDIGGVFPGTDEISPGTCPWVCWDSLVLKSRISLSLPFPCQLCRKLCTQGTHAAVCWMCVHVVLIKCQVDLWSNFVACLHLLHCHLRPQVISYHLVSWFPPPSHGSWKSTYIYIKLFNNAIGGATNMWNKCLAAKRYEERKIGFLEWGVAVPLYVAAWASDRRTWSL